MSQTLSPDRTEPARTGTAGSAGPLAGLRIVELAGIGPAPYGAMLLGDLGADIIRIERPGNHAGNPVPPEQDFMNRSRRSVALDLKQVEHLEIAKNLIGDADALIEGFRPGVAERIGLGPEVCMRLNPRLVYARMTGWGQTGELAAAAGHDINYLARSGVLHAIGTPETPCIPLNLLGDFGGGGMLLGFGLLAGVLSARSSGQGQVIDVAMLDGIASLTTMLHAWRHAGIWVDDRRANMLDGGAHFYNVYQTADGRHVSVGAIEPVFYQQLGSGLGLDDDPQWQVSHQQRELWPAMRERVAAIIRSRSLAEWSAVFDCLDACVAPVLTPDEALSDQHHLERGVFIDVAGRMQPGVVPRFAGTPPPKPQPHAWGGADTASVVQALAEGSSPWLMPVPSAMA